MRIHISVYTRTKMRLLLLLSPFLVFSQIINVDCIDDNDIMTPDMVPNPGPEMETVYIPGNPGGQWTPEEIDSTRRRVTQMIHPDWEMKLLMGTADTRLGHFLSGFPGDITESTVLRLAFHDCIKYVDGTGGCDGCLNWSGMYAESRSPHKENHTYAFTPAHNTDNRGLDGVAEKLELIYNSIDWPFQTPSLEVSLYQSGKSRADLWQFAALVALEQALERANRACDLDFHARQQVTLLEGREKCEIKLTKPLKFLTGRIDCVSNYPKGEKYKTLHQENQPKLFGDSLNIVDYGKQVFGMDAPNWMALQAIHASVHNVNFGSKYTWFGFGYISNMYFKKIANKPMYYFEKGGDLSFTDCINSPDQGEAVEIHQVSYGDIDGNPVARTGWRASCMYLYNTTEGGPCLMRPIPDNAFEAPNKDKLTYPKCIKSIVDGECIPETKFGCANAWCDRNNVVHDGAPQHTKSEVIGPWSEDLSDAEKHNRHAQGWNNQFSLPYEVGMYWNFTTRPDAGLRPIGCPGLNEPFGTIDKPNWPYRNYNHPIWASPAMQCEKNQYAPQGRPLHQIIDEFASDNEIWAENFLEGWQLMTSNGYSNQELIDGPENGWFGFYSLSQQGIEISNFNGYIKHHAPLKFTDPNADPWICGHRGHATTSCGFRFSEYFKLANEAGCPDCNGCIFWDSAIKKSKH